jgi:limonene-1,2-epoxide hydrolase
VLWSVQNSIGAEGLPAEDWAIAASTLLQAQSAVRSAKIVATCEEDEIALDGSRIAGVSVDVLVDAGDADSAAALVEQSLVAALFDVVGDREVGWTAYDWEAMPVRDA